MTPSWLSVLLALPGLQGGEAAELPRPLDSAGPVDLEGSVDFEDSVDFAREVRPLLSDRCFRCHGPDAAAREADLRLDRFEDATADLGGVAAVVPGAPEESLLVERVRHRSARRRMPPPDSGLTLDEDEIALLERWIAGGARYEEHWAFLPPAAPALPEVADAAWPREELDRLVLARLEAEGLAPAPEAERATWLRRVTYDLTGLPPTPEELDAFLADAAPDAHERVVDRLLASPAQAERLAIDWMETARYADTWGYQNDVGRRVWPWRDWLLRAFQEDLPWDDFATWQLAGDLLPDATREQRLATAFNRLHRMTNEGGSEEEEFRVESVADRVNTFGTAFLGLTLECARCHDHKYDPVSQRDYYRLFDFFDDVDESGLYSHFTSAVPTPTLWLPDGAQERELARLEAAVAAREAQLADARARQDAALAAWRADRPATLPVRGRVLAHDFERVEGRTVPGPAARDDAPAEGAPNPAGSLAPTVTVVAEPGRGRALAFDGDGAASFPAAAFTRDDPFTIALRLRVDRVHGRAVVLHRSRAWHDAGSRGYELLLEDGRLSLALIHFWPGNAVRVRALEPLAPGAWHHVALTHDGSGRARGLRILVDGRPVGTEVVRDALTRTIQGGGEGALALAERFRDRGLTGGRIDDLEVFDRELATAEVAALASAARPSLAARAEVRLADLAPGSAAERELHALAVSEELAAARAALRDARRARSELVDRIPEIVAMQALDEPRTARLLERGSHASPGEPVTPGTPEAIRPFPADAPPDRLGLSRWLTDGDNPLFARVAVNRAWRQLFGRGLVATPEDLGNQGAVPEHPELLDHLAVGFARDGYSMRRLLRRIALSATYRQSSRADAALLARDPENALLTRGPRKPLTAEMVRDGALAVSGLLVDELGGPPVFPYQPPGLWQEKSGAVYRASEGEGLWRRSLYTYWKRTSPPPVMQLFDAAKRDVCVVDRQRTQTPLQALALWNDPQQLEAARHLAARVLREVEGGDDRRLVSLFRRVTARTPDPAELDALLALLGDARDAFAAEPGAAARYLAAGTLAADAPVADDELAAWAVAAGAVLASDAHLTLR
jgi:hypothetical protein